MIFDKDFDRTLWMILSADKKNRNRITEFIRSIPSELYQKIQKSISVYKEYESSERFDSGYLDETLLSGNYETHDRILYWYELDDDFGSLELGYSVYNGEKYEEAFELTLEPYNNKIEYFEDECIGNLDYDITESGYTSTCNEIEYNMVKTPFGIFVVSMLEDKNDKEKLGINRVNLRNMPDEMFMTDFSHKDSINRLIRKKR